MIKAEVSNCNNVNSATILLKENILNIYYAMNGTGKSTVAKAIELSTTDDDLLSLKPFGSSITPTCVLSPANKKVLLFNEDFVNDFVFQESDLIKNAFEVFIKSPEYERRQKIVNDRLNKIRLDVNQYPDLERLVTIGKSVLSRFTVTPSGELRQTGLVRSLNSENIYQLPEKLIKFKPLMQKSYTVDWVGWKNEGGKYDDNRICPFCTSDLNEEYDTQKKVFTSSYTESNVKNIKEALSYFDEVKSFMEPTKSAKLYECIRETKDSKEVNYWLKKFRNELGLLVTKISDVQEFNSYRVKNEGISKLDEQLKQLTINPAVLEIFDSQKVRDLINFINGKIDSILKEVDSLKREIGELKGFIGKAKNVAIKDINDFLEIAGINYKIDILDMSETESRAILQYAQHAKDPIEIDNIKLHLSWGERNAFALVLFMRHAISQNPDIIILDDPISSFDSNKKYAIIDRLFSSNPQGSFCNKTVLMLTHDLQPIIDFIVNKKPTTGSVSASFLQNKDGVIVEQDITEGDIKSLPIILDENSKNGALPMLHRLACLRKLLEHMPRSTNSDLAYDILSSLFHIRPKPTHHDEVLTALTPEETKLGEEFIKLYIGDFDYNLYSSKIFAKENILKSFMSESNSYFRLQTFRVLLVAFDLRKMIDDALLKYIDEQMHIENDYMFALNYMKYDIVPSYVIPKCLSFLKAQRVIS